MKKIFLVLMASIIFFTVGCSMKKIDFVNVNPSLTDDRTGSVPDNGLYLAPVKFGNNWGYIDQNGIFVIKPEFLDAKSFSSEGLALVRSEKGWQYIDKNGDYAFDFRFSGAMSFAEGLACIRINGKWGYIDIEGNIVIEAEYTKADSFSEGFAVVSADGIKNGYMDKTGDFVIEPIYTEASPFSDGLAFVYPYFNGPDPAIKSIYIGYDGEVALQPLLQGYFYGNFSEGLAIVMNAESELYGYMNKAGELAIEAKFISALPFINGIAAASISDGYGYIDSSGEFVIEANWFFAGNLIESMAPATYVGKKWGFIDDKGRIIIDFEFNETRSFRKVF